MRTIFQIIAGAAFAVGSPPAVAQIVWNPTSDYSTASGNPNGVWTYGWMDTSFTTFTPYTNHSAINWYGWGGDNTPGIWLNTGGGYSYGVPPGFISLHPGNGTQPSILRWTAPAGYGGLTQVTGQFLSGDSGTMQVAVRFNGAVLWNATDAGAFDLSVPISPGATLDFAVFGGYFSGNTPLQLNITGVPEPTTASLLGAGLACGALFRFARSRRRLRARAAELYHG